MGICGNKRLRKRYNYDIDECEGEKQNNKDIYLDNINKRKEETASINRSMLREKEKEIDKKRQNNNNNKNNRYKPKKGELINHEKMPNIPNFNIGRSYNEKTNFLDKKNQNYNLFIKKKHKKKGIKGESNNENDENLNEKENKKKISPNMNINVKDNPIDYNANGDEYNDNEKSPKNIFDDKNKENEIDKKIFTNNGDDNIKSINKISEKIKNSNKNEMNYINFDINKNFFFGCPRCLNAPYIEKINDFNKDILVEYICKCKLKDKTNLVNLDNLIIEEEPINSCQKHFSEELVYYCKTCKMKICKDCYREDHYNHEINNNYLMSEENEKRLVALTDKFKGNLKGYEILLKMYDEYIKGKKINNIEKLHDNLNIKNDKDNRKEINNDKVEKDFINFNESYKNEGQIDISKYIFESGFQSQSLNVPNINIKNSELEEIINWEKNPNLNSSIKDNNNNFIKNESQNTNDFRLFGGLEKSGRTNTLYNINENPKNIPLNSIKEEINESRNILINEENDVINPKNEKLKYYYNSNTLEGHENIVISLIQLESGYLVSGANDGSIIIWDICSNKIIRKFYEKGQVLCLLEFESNKLLAGTSETNIGLWDLNTLEESSLFNFVKHSLWVNCLVKIDNNSFASASNDCYIYVWDYYKKNFLFELAGHTDSILTLIKLNDGRLCSGSADMTIKIWNLDKRECDLELIGHNNWVKSLYQLKNGILLSCDDNKSLIIWKNFNLNKSIKCNYEYRNLCQIDDNCLACAAFNNVIDLLDLNNYKKYYTLKGHNSNVICVIKLKDNKLASCSLDKTIKIWEQKL